MRYLKLFLVVFILFLCPKIVYGTVLYLEPAEGDYYIEDTFIVDVRIDAKEEINAVKVELEFSQDLLAAVNFSKGGSVLTFWPEEPSFSNKKGTLSFIGGTPKGHQGDGLLGKIVFKVNQIESNGKVNIRFLETSQVFLNDGLGTKVDLVFEESFFEIFAEKLEESKNEWDIILQEDNVAPEPFEIIISQNPSIFENKHFIIFFTTDEQTGIDYYEVKEGDREWKRAESPYLLEDQDLKSVIKVKAVDKAGNEIVVEYSPIKDSFNWWIIIIFILIVLGLIVYKIIRKKLARLL